MYLNLARAAGEFASYTEQLVKLSRVAEAVEFGLTAFRSPDDALALAKALRQAGSHDEALKIAGAGLGLEGEKRGDWHRPVSALAHWLRDYAAGLGRTSLAIETASIEFDCTLSMEDYMAAKNWAGESWAELRAKLLERLGQEHHASDRVRIYLSEAMIDEAVACVGDKETFGIGDETLMQLADAAHASHSAGSSVWRESNCRCAACRRASTRWRTGPHCMKMSDRSWQNAKRGIALSAITP